MACRNGEGFVMQKIEGDGLAFVHSEGTLAKKELRNGEILKVDTGCLVGFTKDVDYDIEFIGGIKNSIFAGEGLFFDTLRVPGTVYIQSFLSAVLPIELLLQHLKQAEIVIRKEAYLS